ncbi:MarR family winged helix-turn-helix transcriptional regulator [Streptosporangium roseum]|uniref:Transcriptional regulator, Mar family n=1 Tax=Streptosporangium roseum (strain ATCC 12428 / DSM 43021 / JCM 3005 / KCTC 9067 / NCIMB 10171 / NRRL 2505 / NI 9100) TaxID=479432 RepID=D2AQT0_STRRD|nr:MarR family winged helix-turn-helix transcriptional regulator [Streptosporangium roseum]ACZ86477.1 transcriptional regulator, Mar family [Streptosporangium roseum DSM 43021]
MSTGEGLTVDEGIRTLLMLMPRLVGRAKRIPIPEPLQSLDLAPRHLSLLAYLLFDGPLSVNELAGRLEVAPTTVSLMVGELSRKGVVDRHEDDADRRRTIVSIAEANRASVDAWLARGARAWRKALEPLTHEQREMFVETLRTYEREAAAEYDGA